MTDTTDPVPPSMFPTALFPTPLFPTSLSRRAVLGGSAAAGLLLTAPPGLCAAGRTEPAVDRDTLVVALQRNFSNLNALVAITSDSNRYLLQIYDTLYGFDASGTLVPRVATSYASSEDGLAHTYRLRPGVKFHHGGELTSADVKFSLEHVLDPASKSTRRPQFAPIIASVETPDPLTVVFRLKAPDGAFPNKIAGYLPLVPKEYGSSQPAADFFARSPVSVGPYRVKAFSDGESLELERFEEYWDAKPGIKRLLFKVIPEPDSRTNALLAGEVDLAAGVPAQNVARLRDVAGLDVIASPLGSPLMVNLYSNQPGQPLAKRAVRQALSYALDTPSIIRNVLHGIGDPLATIISKHYPYGADPTLQPYPYDPKKAPALLAEAGYPGGFETKLYSGNDHPKEIAEALAAYWGQIGVKTSIQRIDYATWAQLNNTRKTNPMTIQQMANAIYDPIHPLGGTYGRDGTWSNYDNAEVQDLIDQAGPLRGAEARGALFRKIGRLLNEDAAGIYISELYDVFAKKNGISWEAQGGIGLLNFRKVAWA
ncbi:ABC transporter substrate-binding protein [Azospirillum melinis]